MTSQPPKNDEKKTNSGLFLALSIAWDLGYIIVLPVAIFGFAGAYADKHFQTSPLYLLIGIGLSLLITVIGLYRQINSLIKKMNERK